MATPLLEASKRVPNISASLAPGWGQVVARDPAGGPATTGRHRAPRRAAPDETAAMTREQNRVLGGVLRNRPQSRPRSTRIETSRDIVRARTVAPQSDRHPD